MNCFNVIAARDWTVIDVLNFFECYEAHKHVHLVLVTLMFQLFELELCGNGEEPEVQREKRTSTPSKRGRGCHLEENSQVMGGRSCQNSSQPLIFVNFISTILAIIIPPHHRTLKDIKSSYLFQTFFSSLRALVSVFLKSYHPSIYGGLWDLYTAIQSVSLVFTAEEHSI